MTPDLSGLRPHLAVWGLNVQEEPGALTFADPWGNRITVRQTGG